MTTPDTDQTLRVDSTDAYVQRRRRDEEQFAPGTVIAGRYRIASILGSGGMGEVYRAEDTKLGQTVALKFLPARLARDPLLLSRLHEEVRLGRQIAHPNVCRIYDIGEAEGSHFLAMEYVDGEDLGRLLTRIGRLAPDKAADIARGIAAGLAAAHAKGILHRDLKPANIMIDSRGDARIMDFGLALDDGKADGTVSGTPAYMAPEQFAGEPASVQSDLYALGLVMYEVFTGKRAHSGRTMPERLRDITSDITTPSSHIRDIDPAVERIILRCLSNEAAQRPRSAREVINALPGGDPLQAALAAGETPSPRIVAAAGTAGSLKPAAAWALVAAVLAMFAALFVATVRTRHWQRAGLTRAPEVQAERASELLRTLGVPAQEFRSFGYDDDIQRMRWLMRHAPERLKRLNGDVTVVRFWLREEPAPLIDRGFTRTPEPALDAPVQSAPGSVAVEITPRGRLISLSAIAAADWKPRAGDWTTPLLRAAGFDPAEMQPAPPRLVPRSFGDTRAAWSGRHPEDGTPVHVEAAAFRGVPVAFRVIAPWDAGEFRSPFGAASRFAMFGTLLFCVAIATGAALAWRNLRQRRGDRQGALRVGIVVFAIAFVRHLASADHEAVLLHEIALFTGAVSDGLFYAAMYALTYLAFEPYIRRRWPQGLISWARLVAGNWRDPMIGRDVLIGSGAGLIHAILASGLVPNELNAGVFVTGEASNFNTSLEPLAHITRSVVGGVTMGMMLMLLLMLFMVVLRRRALAAAGVFALFMIAYSRVSTEPAVLASFAVVSALLAFVLARYGLLAMTVAHATFVAIAQFSMPDALDWYTLRAIAPSLLFVALAIWAFRTSLGGQPVFAKAFDAD